MPDLPLVDMRVHIDEAGQHDALVEIETPQAVMGGRWRINRRDTVLLDDDIAGREALGVCYEPRRIGGEAHRDARIGEAEAGEGWRDGKEVGRHSPFLLCQ